MRRYNPDAPFLWLRLGQKEEMSWCKSFLKKDVVLGWKRVNSPTAVPGVRPPLAPSPGLSDLQYAQEVAATQNKLRTGFLEEIRNPPFKNLLLKELLGTLSFYVLYF